MYSFISTAMRVLRGTSLGIYECMFLRAHRLLYLHFHNANKVRSQAGISSFACAEKQPYTMFKYPDFHLSIYFEMGFPFI